MGNFVLALIGRMRVDSSRSTTECKWLIEMLNADTGVAQCWLLWPARARAVCRKLGIEYHLPAYYRIVYFWVPHLQFGVRRCHGVFVVKVYVMSLYTGGGLTIQVMT